MTRAPQLSGSHLVKALAKVGYQVVRQRGSHIRLNHPTKRPISVPNHARIGKGLLTKILRDAELTVEHLRDLL